MDAYKIYHFLDKIAFNLKEADAAFRFYCSLLKMRKSNMRLKYYNNYIYSFHHATNLSLFDFINNAIKITEKSEVKNIESHPISFPLLRHYLFEKGTKKQQIIINKIGVKMIEIKNKISDVRNKIIAHSDQNVDDKIIISKANRRDIRYLLDLSMRLLNIYLVIYKSNIPPYFFDDGIDKELLDIYFKLKNDNDRTKRRFENISIIKNINIDIP
ncbi:hypothetical protein [Rodentibacter rarus]|nr:hypothetical protein [Rodentibacter rarus]